MARFRSAVPKWKMCNKATSHRLQITAKSQNNTLKLNIKTFLPCKPNTNEKRNNGNLKLTYFYIYYQMFLLKNFLYGKFLRQEFYGGLRIFYTCIPLFTKRGPLGNQVGKTHQWVFLGSLCNAGVMVS